MKESLREDESGKETLLIENTDTVISSNPVEIEDICELRVCYPDYSKKDLVCGSMPSKDDQSIIMFAEAAFTGELLEDFEHYNIARIVVPVEL